MESAVVYIVAGMSSRFGGKIKQFAPVGPDGETLIEYSVNQAISAGFTRLHFVVSSKTIDGFYKLFGNSYKGVSVSYSYQKYDGNLRDRPWGTADAVVSVKGVVDCPFVVCNGDDIYGEKTFKMLHEHLENSSDCASVGYNVGEVIPEEDVVNRGIFYADNGYITEIKEVLGVGKKNLAEKGLSEKSLASMNIFAMNPLVVKLLDEKVQEFIAIHKDDRKIECYLTEKLSELIKEGRIRMKLYGASDRWVGLTYEHEVEEVRRKLKRSLT